MDGKRFDDSDSALGRVLCYVGVVLLATLILGQGLFLIGNNSLHGTLLGAARFSPFLAALTLGAFCLRCHSLPLLREGCTLLAEYKALQAELTVSTPAPSGRLRLCFWYWQRYLNHAVIDSRWIVDCSA